MSASNARLLRERPTIFVLVRPAGMLVRRGIAAALQWAERARERRHLQELDDRLLKDIGLSRSEVARECAKPFWQP